MSLYPEQKKLIDEIYGLLKTKETSADGMVHIQIQLLIQWMLIANAHEVLVDTVRDWCQQHSSPDLIQKSKNENT